MTTERQASAAQETRQGYRIQPTALDWERVRERARQAHRSMSEYLRKRAFDPAHESESTDTPPSVAPPTADDWRELARQVRDARERLTTDRSGRFGYGLLDLIARTFRSRALQMMRTKREAEFEKLLREALGPERATGVYRAIGEQLGASERPR